MHDGRRNKCVRLHTRAKVILRYPAATSDLERHILPDPLDLWCDADWAGDCVKRKSCFQMQHCGAHLGGSIMTQAVTATSRVGAACNLFWCSRRAWIEECSEQFRTTLKIRTDSSSGAAIAVRWGFVRTRHTDVRWLFIQELVRGKQLPGIYNGSDRGGLVTSRTTDIRLAGQIRA